MSCCVTVAFDGRITYGDYGDPTAPNRNSGLHGAGPYTDWTDIGGNIWTTAPA